MAVAVDCGRPTTNRSASDGLNEAKKKIKTRLLFAGFEFKLTSAVVSSNSGRIIYMLTSDHIVGMLLNMLFLLLFSQRPVPSGLVANSLRMYFNIFDYTPARQVPLCCVPFRRR